MFCLWRLIAEVLSLEIVEVLSHLEVDVITELWPVDVLQKVEVMLFFTRYTSDLPALVCSCCCRWMFTVLQR